MPMILFAWRRWFIHTIRVAFDIQQQPTANEKKETSNKKNV